MFSSGSRAPTDRIQSQEPAGIVRDGRRLVADRHPHAAGRHVVGFFKSLVIGVPKGFAVFSQSDSRTDQLKQINAADQQHIKQREIVDRRWQPRYRATAAARAFSLAAAVISLEAWRGNGYFFTTGT